ncbi:hypothetical protein T492DRAFT_1064342 [Pavlovales sp. CCMP2436]|nr:hypothetical protein T492DRAFT_1064342 [Pavlovales sp. CCMP2436]
MWGQQHTWGANGGVPSQQPQHHGMHGMLPPFASLAPPWVRQPSSSPRMPAGPVKLAGQMQQQQTYGQQQYGQQDVQNGYYGMQPMQPIARLLPPRMHPIGQNAPTQQQLSQLGAAPTPQPGHSLVQHGGDVLMGGQQMMTGQQQFFVQPVPYQPQPTLQQRPQQQARRRWPWQSGAPMHLAQISQVPMRYDGSSSRMQLQPPHLPAAQDVLSRFIAVKRNRVATPEDSSVLRTCTRDDSCAKEHGHKGRCGTTARAHSDDRQWLDDQINALFCELDALKSDRDRLKRESRSVWARLCKACILLDAALKVDSHDISFVQQPAADDVQSLQPSEWQLAFTAEVARKLFDLSLHVCLENHEERREQFQSSLEQLNESMRGMRAGQDYERRQADIEEYTRQFEHDIKTIADADHMRVEANAIEIAQTIATARALGPSVKVLHEPIPEAQEKPSSTPASSSTAAGSTVTGVGMEM